MKLRKLKHWPWRVRLLITGKSVWVSPEGEETTEHLPWSTRWAITGIHSNNWWWVNKWGGQECGCVINPLTRRRVLYLMGCPENHCGFDLDED